MLIFALRGRADRPNDPSHVSPSLSSGGQFSHSPFPPARELSLTPLLPSNISWVASLQSPY